MRPHARFTGTLLPLAAALALASTGCYMGLSLTDGGDGWLYGEKNPAADIAGEWAMHADACCTSSGGSYFTGWGSLVFVTGGQFGGSAAINGPHFFEVSGIIGGATKDGAALTFRVASCSFEGEVRGADSSLKLHGTYDCGPTIAGGWHAVRAVPPLTFRWPILARTLLVGDVFRPSLDVTDANGRLLFRALTLATSDPTVAAIETGGAVRAVGPGTATISATAVDAAATIAVTVLD